ncbi:MAG: neutral zinc metallopeptidase [Myxococcota bacterium]|jgi:predicted metalloprotease|nr:neutral zinc metallopeptidase [Myxococcota bacterium]
MRWEPGKRSADVEDRRGLRSTKGKVGIGLGGVVVLVALSLLTGKDFLSGVALQSPSPAATGVGSTAPASPEEERTVQFMHFVIDDVQTAWDRLLPGYRHAKLVLFREAVDSACGAAESATGPFYCPGDEKVYLDVSFFEELKRRFGAPGDFAQAYVIAHEIGHHVQRLDGTNARVRALQRQDPAQANALSVLMELQADCYAGVYGAATARKGTLEPGDVEEGLAAAAAIGDDRIQRQAGRRVVPDSFTHGSSAQRTSWLRRGLTTGQPGACDTFAAIGGLGAR